MNFDFEIAFEFGFDFRFTPLFRHRGAEAGQG
jgi:hypothetical protein